ncbi:MAG TPA: ArsC/Spx/MgsR family protein [Flavipsychrobacter sp.]|nr:ArsC/Spx/MgsR family protein [Flavipsychrobacter sp.]
MNNKIYHLSTCDTCKKILKEINAAPHDFEIQDIKIHPLTEKQIDALAKRAGSYEALISKKATLWKERKLSDKKLSEEDYKKLLLEHYTFLKRPVIDYNGKLFVGNEKKTVGAIKEALV